MRGGIFIMIDKDGYERIHIPPGYPYAAGRKIIMRHVVMMERLIERPIRKDEVVHHIDSNRMNNDAGNLELMKRSEHQSIGASRQRRDARGRFR